MERFRADPADPGATGDTLHRGAATRSACAERELSRMQTDLRAALASRARLAALGEAVAKINHDLRNMLTSAQLASERLSRTRVIPQGRAQALPRDWSGRSDRAVDPGLQRAHLRQQRRARAGQVVRRRSGPPLDAAAEDAGLDPGRRRLGQPHRRVSDCGTVNADPEQLHRILVNLLRNARQAIDGVGDRAGRRRCGRRRRDGGTTLSSSPSRTTGPGLPDRARDNLFQPFAGPARQRRHRPWPRHRAGTRPGPRRGSDAGGNRAPRARCSRCAYLSREGEGLFPDNQQQGFATHLRAGGRPPPSSRPPSRTMIPVDARVLRRRSRRAHGQAARRQALQARPAGNLSAFRRPKLGPITIRFGRSMAACMLSFQSSTPTRVFST